MGGGDFGDGLGGGDSRGGDDFRSTAGGVHGGGNDLSGGGDLGTGLMVYTGPVVVPAAEKARTRVSTYIPLPEFWIAFRCVPGLLP